MGLINYKDIDFKKSINKELKTFDFNGSEIGVVPYLSINDKYSLVMTTLNVSFENGIYNAMKINTFFDLYLVKAYTNILFDKEDEEDEVLLYDTLKNSGLLDKVKNAIPKEEYNELKSYVFEIADCYHKYGNNFGNLVNKLFQFVKELPEKAKNAMELMKTMDPETLEKITGPLGNLLKGFQNIDETQE